MRTIIGLGLFEFGDVDGDDFRVRMQHPIGITHHVSDDGGGVLYVADTYNHKIKRVLPKTRSAFTVAGVGKPGHVDGPFAQARFSEPSGLSIATGMMYIADTNNHTIRVANMETGEVATLELTGSVRPEQEEGQWNPCALLTEIPTFSNRKPSGRTTLRKSIATWSPGTSDG